MSDAYGNLVVSFSKDFKGNKLALCAVLNEIGSSSSVWSNGYGEFVEAAEEIYFESDGYNTQYPTVFVERIIGYKFYNEDMKAVEVISIEELDEEDYEIFEEGEPELEVISLSELCTMLSKHITAGTLSLSACATQKGFYCYFEELNVNSNGSGERLRRSAYTGDAPQSFVESC